MPVPSLTARAPARVGGYLDVEVAGPRTSDTVLWLVAIAEGPTLDLGFLGHRGIAAYIDPVFVLFPNFGANRLVVPIGSSNEFVAHGVAVQALVAGGGGLAASGLLRFAIGE
ncbi:MAG: hypothetical protein KDC87_09345 [Planctomycetes bacterium]|nr:hypothetical protein [Planctomycetota bacterium]